MTDSSQRLQSLSEKVVVELNTAIPPAIRSAGYDRWDNVCSGTEKLGKVDLFVCTATAKAKYEIKNMEGLSSLRITALNLSEVARSVSEKGTRLTGNMTLDAVMDEPVQAKVGGKIVAKCSVFGETVKESVGMDGKVKIKGGTAAATGTFDAMLTDTTCLTDAEFLSLRIGYSGIDVDVGDLGFFEMFVNSWEKLLLAIFKDDICKLIADVTKDVLEDVVDDEVPICTE